MSEENLEASKQQVLARYKTDEASLKAQLKFKAIIVLCSSVRFITTVQIINDLCSSKDGTVLGPKRTKSDPQVVDFIMTNPDLLYADQWPAPRFGPKALTVMIKAVFKETNGFELHC